MSPLTIRLPVIITSSANVVPMLLAARRASTASNCVCIAEVTPSTYPNSVAVTSDTAILPYPEDTKALEAVKSLVSTVLMAPAIFATRLASTLAVKATVLPTLDETMLTFVV